MISRINFYFSLISVIMIPINCMRRCRANSLLKLEELCPLSFGRWEWISYVIERLERMLYVKSIIESVSIRKPRLTSSDDKCVSSWYASSKSIKGCSQDKTFLITRVLRNCQACRIKFYSKEFYFNPSCIAVLFAFNLSLKRIKEEIIFLAMKFKKIFPNSSKLKRKKNNAKSTEIS